MEVKSRRVGGANYQVPFLFVKIVVWLCLCVGLSSLHVSVLAYNAWLAAELIEAANQRGNAFKIEDTHKMARVRAFSRYAGSFPPDLIHQ